MKKFVCVLGDKVMAVCVCVCLLTFCLFVQQWGKKAKKAKK